MKRFLLIVSLLLIVGCDRNKQHHKLTVNLCKYKPNACACNLYLEVYTVFGMGALGSDLNSEYLTDSLNFRKYIGKYDEEDEKITVKCAGDSIHIIKTKATSSKTEWNVPKIMDDKKVSLKQLVKNHQFD